MADKPNHPDLAAIADAHDDVTRPRAFRAAQTRAAADVELTAADAVAVNPAAADGPVQAQGMLSDSIDKAMEEFAEHVQPKINDAIDEVMDMAFGEDGTDGNGNTDDDAGGDSGGESGGESGGGEGGGGDSGGASSERRVHQPVRLHEADLADHADHDASFTEVSGLTMEVQMAPIAPTVDAPDWTPLDEPTAHDGGYSTAPVGLEVPEIDDLNL